MNISYIKSNKLFIIVMYFVAILDYISTWIALDIGFTEKNAIFSQFTELPFYLIVLIDLIVLSIIISVAVYFKISKVSQYIIMVFYILLVLSNYVVLILAGLNIIKPY